MLAAHAIFATGLMAAYSNLAATADGNTVYFKAPGSPIFVIRSGVVAVAASPNSSLDMDDADKVSAVATYIPRSCGSGGSTCSVAPACAGGFSITGPAGQFKGPNYETLIRLDRGGQLTWIEQSLTCYSFETPLPWPRALNGLYEVSSMRQVAPSAGATLANRRSGRRLITDKGRVLTFVGSQLTWVDASGRYPIRHVSSAFEAVTDSAGTNVVYTDGSDVGRLHWIDSDDHDLGLAGSAPALSDDGTLLFFLALDGSLQVYDRAMMAVRQINSGAYTDFTLAGSAIFAAAADGSLVRIDLATERTSTWLDPAPVIDTLDAPTAGLAEICPLPCYGQPRYNYVGRSMVLTLEGEHLDAPGWRVRTVGIGSALPVYPFDVPLQPVWTGSAWFQIPSDMPLNVRPGSEDYQLLEIYKPDHPVATSLRIKVQQTVVSCIQTVHEDFSGLVAASSPARIGETVHVFLTGLSGVEPVPDGVANPSDHFVEVANPPTLADPRAFKQVIFNLLPSFVGLQQVDLQIQAPPTAHASLFTAVNSFGCAPPSVSDH